MGTYSDFIKKLLPANYFITKSMELSRLDTAGSLWYTKKFLVLYYYIFLNGNIETKAKVSEIKAIFDAYIESMPGKMQPTAKKFFYSSYSSADLRSDKFKLFSKFAGSVPFANESERVDYYEMAKKYYMAFLMESGGQSGVKKHIKDNLYSEDFCFSKIDSIIKRFDNTYTDRELTGIKNDYMAFLRNERQILFYFGIFHSKSTGASDREFSSLTPVGHLALHATYLELIAVWEHQKIKMLSQPVTIDMNQIGGLKVDCNLFSINRDPYLTIINWLDNKGKLTKKEYTYIVSRSKGVLSSKEINEFQENIDKIGNAIERFTRRGDKLDSADFLKELKKYMLGIINLKNDFDSNIYSCCEYNAANSEFTVSSKSKLKSVMTLYSHLANYKHLRYNELFDNCERELRRQYSEKVSGNDYSINPTIKIDWDLYNIHIDKYIYLCTLVAVAEPTVHSSFSNKSINDYVQAIKDLFPTSMNILGLSAGALKRELVKIDKAFSTTDYSILLPEDTKSEAIIPAYSQEASEGLLKKIIVESNKNAEYEDGERKRNHTLISLIKRYNINVYSTNGLLNCECCNNPTFITYTDDAYVEYHHLIPFSICDGPDDYKNIYALCPNCHRKMHYLRLSEKNALYQGLSANNYLKETIEERLIDLFKIGKVRSYQLEYLLADNAITTEQYNHILNC